MKLKVGDKVKFLNQIGGGIVTKIVSSQIVNVTDDTGFDIPTLVKDLIKVEPMQGAGKLFELADEMVYIRVAQGLRRLGDGHALLHELLGLFNPHQDQVMLGRYAEHRLVHRMQA